MRSAFLERGEQMEIVGKNPTKIGLVVHEIWLVEVQKFVKMN